MTGDDFLQAIRDAAKQMREYRTPSPWPCVLPDWVFDLTTPEELAREELRWGCKFIRYGDR